MKVNDELVERARNMELKKIVIPFFLCQLLS